MNAPRTGNLYYSSYTCRAKVSSRTQLKPSAFGGGGGDSSPPLADLTESRRNFTIIFQIQAFNPIVANRQHVKLRLLKAKKDGYEKIARPLEPCEAPALPCFCPYIAPRNPVHAP